MKDEIEDNPDFKKARQEDEDLFKQEIKEYLDSGLTEDKIIEYIEKYISEYNFRETFVKFFCWCKVNNIKLYISYDIHII